MQRNAGMLALFLWSHSKSHEPDVPWNETEAQSPP
jgi:hypothetical protein